MYQVTSDLDDPNRIIDFPADAPEMAVAGVVDIEGVVFRSFVMLDGTWHEVRPIDLRHAMQQVIS